MAYTREIGPRNATELTVDVPAGSAVTVTDSGRTIASPAPEVDRTRQRRHRVAEQLGLAARNLRGHFVVQPDELRDERRRRVGVQLGRRGQLLEPARFITPTRSATASASSWSWVTNSVVVPTSSWTRRISSRSCDAHLGVERRERLVEQQHARLDRQRPGQRDPLLLAAGQLAGVLVARAPTARRGRASRPRAMSRSPLGLAAHLEAERDVVEHGQVREQAVRLEHHAHVALVGGHPGEVLAADRRRVPDVGLVEAGQDAQRGGLAAARRAEQRDQLAGFDVQGEPVERLDVAVDPGQVVEFDGDCRGSRVVMR